MGDAVVELDHLQQLQRPVDLLLLRHLVPQRLEDVLDDGHVPEQGKGPLEHDGDAPADLGLEGILVVQGPEVDLLYLHVPTALAAVLAFERQLRPAAGITGIESIDDLAGIGPVVWRAPQHVDEDGLASAAASDQAQDLPGSDGGTDIPKSVGPTELFADIVNNYELIR